MAGYYIIKALTKFSAAHALHGYEGDCARIHGHNWTVEAEVRVDTLNSIGIALDFRTLRIKLREVADIIEHQYLNEISPFDTINPTAENIAAWFYKKLQILINDQFCNLIAITIWETENYSTRYAED